MELFGTAGIRGDARSRVTPELALSVGRAVGAVLGTESDRTTGSVVVGRDGRVTGPALAAAVEAGVLSAGTSVERIGVLPTPALAFASRGRAGIMLTASHNPPSDNGLKVFLDGVEIDQSLESAIETAIDEERPPARWDEWARPSTGSILPAYRSAVTAYARGFGESIDELAVAIDCGNGMAALATPHVLRTLGA
ncbi:MAG: phosphomannomutase, partial [Halobacteriota archaeon]